MMTSTPQSAPRWTIRRAIPDDGPDLLRVHQAAILAARGRGYSEEQLESWATGLLAGRYAESMTNRAEDFLVAISGKDEVIGFCSHSEDRVIALYVDPSWQGRGIASALLSRAESRILDNGHRQCRIEAALPSRSFYRSRGYKQAGERDDTTRGGLNVRVVDMVRPLP